MTNYLGIGQMFKTKIGIMAYCALLGTAAFVGSELGRLSKGEKTKTESVFDYAKTEYDTYKEIKKEGIQADSYSEAKEKLRSIKTDRLYRSYGMTPPDKNSSAYEQIMKSCELEQKQLNEMINTLNSIIQKTDSVENVIE